MRILVVDDSKVCRSILLKALAGAGALVDVANDGVNALAMLASREALEDGYNLIWTDLRMPELDGLGLAREIRGFYQNLGIVFFTGSTTHEQDEIIRGMGCCDVIFKPATPREIVRAAKNCACRSLCPTVMSSHARRESHLAAAVAAASAAATTDLEHQLPRSWLPNAFDESGRAHEPIGRANSERRPSIPRSRSCDDSLGIVRGLEGPVENVSSYSRATRATLPMENTKHPTSRISARGTPFFLEGGIEDLSLVGAHAATKLPSLQRHRNFGEVKDPASG